VLRRGILRAVSQESAAVARAYYETLTRVLEGHARQGGRIEDAPFVDELFGYVAADAEWQSFFSAQPFRGRDEWLVGAADWLDAMDDWRAELEDVIDAGEHLVAVLRNRLVGKGSGAPADERMFVVVTVRDGRIARLEDHTDRDAAFAAAGATE
jgi:ketosteroid isomerase-like protein